MTHLMHTVQRSNFQSTLARETVAVIAIEDMSDLEHVKKWVVRGLLVSRKAKWATLSMEKEMR